MVVDETGVYFFENFTANRVTNLVEIWLFKYDHNGDLLWKTRLDRSIPNPVPNWLTYYISGRVKVGGNKLIVALGDNKLWFFDKITGQRISTN